jgi:hypothetical protein
MAFFRDDMQALRLMTGTCFFDGKRYKERSCMSTSIWDKYLGHKYPAGEFPRRGIDKQPFLVDDGAILRDGESACRDAARRIRRVAGRWLLRRYFEPVDRFAGSWGVS